MHRCWFWFRALSLVIGTRQKSHDQVATNILVEYELRDFGREGDRYGGKEGHFENRYRRWYEERRRANTHEWVKC